jgi:ribA/ribD-fused uncharacterized protein
MVKLWTAQYRYPGPYRLDITVKGQDPIGKLFAPTWDMVNKYKQNHNEEEYMDLYKGMMYDSQLHNPQIWNDLLRRDYLVLVCFCKYGNFCHRHLLVAELIKKGVAYHGEIVDFTQWEKKPDSITSFKGAYSWLSNFYPTPITYQNITYASVEHMYQAWKRPAEDRAAYATIDKPKNAAKGLNPAGWHTGIKQAIMLEALKLKFQHRDLREKLLATKDIELIEGNQWHDNYWGNCTCYKCITIHGENMLGKMLMKLRDTL